MNEWSVVLVVMALFGLGASIGKPVVSLTRSITTLTVAVENLQKDMSALASRNSEAHERIRRHDGRQDERLADHEKRIIRIEGK